MKKLRVIFVSIICICALNIKAVIPDNNKLPFHLNNDTLIKCINDYCTKYNYIGKHNLVISLENYQFNDTSFFIISPIITLAYIDTDLPPLFYFELDSVVVVVYSNLSNFISISQNKLDSLYKRVFPEEYKLYLSQEVILPAIHDDIPFLALEFKKDILIDKIICSEQCPYILLIQTILRRHSLKIM